MESEVSFTEVLLLLSAVSEATCLSSFIMITIVLVIELMIVCIVYLIWYMCALCVLLCRAPLKISVFAERVEPLLKYYNYNLLVLQK